MEESRLASAWKTKQERKTQKQKKDKRARENRRNVKEQTDRVLTRCFGDFLIGGVVDSATVGGHTLRETISLKLIQMHEQKKQRLSGPQIAELRLKCSKRSPAVQLLDASRDKVGMWENCTWPVCF